MKTIQITLPEIDDVEFALECLPEDVPVRGNAIVSGDEDFDRETEDAILEDLEWNPWRWCIVRVTAQWNGFEGDDFLGCCSYHSEEDFKTGGYWEDMKQCAFDDLIRTIERLAD